MKELTVFGQTLEALRKERTQAGKINILKAVCLAPHSFQSRLWMYTLNPYLTWGIRDIRVHDGVVHQGHDYSSTPDGLVSLLDDLASRRLTGSAAHWAVRRFFDGLDELGKFGFRAIISRKPRCGVEAALLNKIWPGWIPTFNVMRASRWNENNVRAMINKHGGAIVEVKLDGERRIYVHHLNKPSQFLTCVGNEDAGFPYIIKYLDAVTAPGTVLDGELIAEGGRLGTRQSHLSPLIGSTIVNDASCGVQYAAFDVMSLSDWTRQQCPVLQADRSTWVESFLPMESKQPVCRNYSERVTCFDQLDELYLNLVEMGYEGVIIKSPVAPYHFKTTASKDWFKRKFEKDEEVVILDVLPGDKGGKYELTFGRFWCRRANGVEVMVGRGRMPEELIEWTWSNRADLVGKVIQILHNGETPDGSVNHPRFLAYRDDKLSVVPDIEMEDF